jgi:hypothetical protein
VEGYDERLAPAPFGPFEQAKLRMEGALALVLREERKLFAEACELPDGKLSATVALTEEDLDWRFVLRRLEGEVLEEPRED